ncbi:GGDEF domain-containing protein [Rhizobium sp. RU36D]|uniref:GGDEF domain-containing protein n=1 Tax=Rhizobium sp. RU36D TaxID=1907415 RepID=UPI00117A7FC7|nr:GGDEF domain-containing protein [Rhizobium sp. RU36D]
MIELFHIPTLMLCFFTGSAIVATFVTAMWVKERHRLDLLSWSAAFWIGSIGIFFLAFRNVAPAWFSIGLGNLFAVASPGLFLVGLRAFDGRRPHAWLALPAPMIWGVLYFGVPAFTNDINARIVLVSVMVSVLSVVIAHTGWKGRLAEASMARHAVIWFFASHALVYLSRIPLAYYRPLKETDSFSPAGWFGYYTFELYVHALFAGMAIFVLVRERVERAYRAASESDPLTGILNRRAFLARSQVSMAAGGGALVLVDLDHFKRINDSYGHPAGDAALSTFCRWVELELSPQMIFGRIGGEEFALWLPRHSEEQVAGWCEKLRSKISMGRVETDRGSFGFTVSMGACADLLAEGSMELAMGVADHALYMSKRSGRDRVTVIRAADGVDRAAEALGALTATPPQSALSGVAAVRLV